ncbi:MAG: DUF4837 family protein [Bacteroidales bacterium]|nr:DUF4837 family protein [Bacteroidales bacterium]
MNINYKSLILFIITGMLLFSCNKEQTREDKMTLGLPSSGGKTLEMIVVCDDDLYKGALKDSIGKNFEIPQQGLNQDEPLFDVVHLKPEGFIHSDMLQKHRNIVIIDYKKGNPNKMYSEINKRVFPQAVYKLMVDNQDSLFSILSQFSRTIKKQFYKNEHDRIFNAFKRDENIKITEQIKKTFGLGLVMSSDYYLAKQKDDFFWIRKETKNESYNIMIYKKPFTSADLLNKEKIIDIRNQISKENIPGPAKDSYMGTEERFSIYTDTVKLNDITAIETRGLWRLFGDFMGGPFVNYCFQNPATKDFVMIDCFLYSPKKSKRDLLMQLESIAYSLNREVK